MKMNIKVSLSNSASVDELEQIQRELYENEPSDSADFSAAREYWSSLSPKLLAMELKQCRLNLKNYRKSKGK